MFLAAEEIFATGTSLLTQESERVDGKFSVIKHFQQLLSDSAACSYNGYIHFLMSMYFNSITINGTVVQPLKLIAAPILPA